MKRLILLPLLLAAAAANAAVYKWTDAQGRVHFSDKPVQDATTVQDKVATQAAKQSEESQDKAKEKASKQEECKSAQDQADLYSKADRLIEKDALGNEKEYDAKDKEALMAVQQAKVKDACKGVLTSSTPSAKPAPAPAP